MQLFLEVSRWCERPASQRLRQQFDRFPILIGRSSACDYYLEDPNRHISSNHALISQVGHELIIEDTSANGVYINGQSEPLGRGNTQPLRDGDSLAIGDYLLIISLQQDVSDEFNSPTCSAADDPFAEPNARFTQNARQSLPVHDPFRDDAPDWPPEPSPQVPSVEPPWPGDWPGETADENGSTPTTSSDWDTWPGDDWPRDERTPSNKTTAPSSPSTARREAAPAPSSTESAVQTGDALAILLRAASVPEEDFANLPAEKTLAQIGQLLALMVDAMMVLLHSRAELKNHIRSDITTVSRSDNNPLKFSYDASDALTKLLLERSSGYLAPEQAVAQAANDLKLHQLAMLDGMKSAVSSLLLQFDPKSLSRKLDKAGGISANIPITREAKLWELFCEQYDTIRDEAMNDFTEIYGREFRKAYEARIKKANRTNER